ncbi:MAG: LPS assembly lipoprotein LptE, partial [Gammaproteobacteria bacterium]
EGAAGGRTRDGLGDGSRLCRRPVHCPSFGKGGSGRISKFFLWPGLLCCLALAGCGFHLRPPAQLPAAMRHTYINDSGGNTELVRQLRRSLITPATGVTDDATTATATLNILSGRQFQRVLSVSNTGQPLEYQVAYQVQFSLTDAQGKTLIEPQTLTLTRNYNYDVANALGDVEQANVLFKAMEDNMAQLILFRLQAVGRSAGHL